MATQTTKTQPKRVELSFIFEKETTNTIRFKEIVDDEPPSVNTIYIQKWRAKQMGNPQKIKVVISSS